MLQLKEIMTGDERRVHSSNLTTVSHPYELTHKFWQRF